MKQNIRVTCGKCRATLDHKNITMCGLVSVVFSKPCPVCLNFREVFNRVFIHSYYPPHYVIEAVVKYLMENISDTIDINGYLRELYIYDSNTVLKKTVPYDGLEDL